MRRFQQHFWDWFNIRRATGILLLASLIAAQLPISLPTLLPIHPNELSQAYPCQNRPCGCRSAEQCRKKCCCFTSSQKQDWASRKDVPNEIATASVAEIKTSPATTRRTCCPTSANSATEKKKLASGAPTADENLAKSGSDSKRRSRILIGLFAQQCQGIEVSWTGQFLFVLPSALTFPVYLDVTGERNPVRSSRLSEHSSEPPVPPPRHSAV